MSIKKETVKTQIKKKWWIVPMIGCALLAAAFQTRDMPAFLDAAETQTIPVVRGSIYTTLDYVGNVEYNQSAMLSWKTRGVIESVNVKVGDSVQKGDILASLATDSLDASVIAAEKTMLEQQQNLEDVESSTADKMAAYQTLIQKQAALTQAQLTQEALYYPRATDLELRTAWDELAAAHLKFNYAKQDYDYLVSKNESWIGEENPRIVFRHSRGFGYVLNGDHGSSARERTYEAYVSAYNTYVSEFETFTWLNSEPSDSDYAVAEGAVEVAQAEYDQALKDYLTYQDGPRKKDIALAQVSLDSATSTYNQRYIIAQFDGIVTSVPATEGYYVSKGDAAVQVDDMSQVFIPIEIPELDMTQIKVGMPVQITLDAVGQKVYNGSIFSISEASETGDTRTSFTAKAKIDQPDSKIFAGMTAEVSLTTGEKENVLLVPNAALSYTADGTFVTRAEDGKQIPVSLGTVTESVSEITSANLSSGTLLTLNAPLDQAALEALNLSSDPSQDLNSEMTIRTLPQISPQENRQGNPPEGMPPFPEFSEKESDSQN